MTATETTARSEDTVGVPWQSPALIAILGASGGAALCTAVLVLVAPGDERL